jgi:predicted Ser/Thr protein kinase
MMGSIRIEGAQVESLVAQLLSILHASVAPEVCPGGWAWAVSALGALLGLVPTAGLALVALVRMRVGSRYGGGSGLALGGLGLASAGLVPLAVFVITGQIFANAAAGTATPGIRLRSVQVETCFVGTQSTYLGRGSVIEAFGPGDPVRFGVAALLLGLVPLVTALFFAGQARLVLRRGPSWPSKFFWLPVLGLAVATVGVPAGTAEHLWFGMLVGAFAGMVVAALIPVPSKDAVRRSLAPARPDPHRPSPPPPSARSAAQPYAGFQETNSPTPLKDRLAQRFAERRAEPPVVGGQRPETGAVNAGPASGPVHLAAHPGAVPQAPGRGPVPSRTNVIPPAAPAGPGGIPAPFPTSPGPVHGGPARFRLIRRIGEGGFGRVWLAHDARLGHTVAIKAAHAPDAETEERIRREAAALAAVRHPNCVRIHDLVQARSDPGLAELDGLVIVMEHVEGVSLGQLVREQGVLDDVAAARVWSGVAGALAAAHQKGVLHRDIKPSNIIVDRAGRPHLIDFGIARRTGDATMTMTGFVLGTPDYLAPEVAAGKKASPESDAWQLAATVSYALTGYPPRGGHADAVSGLRAAASGAKLTHLPRRTAHSSLLKAALRMLPTKRPDLMSTHRSLDDWLRRAGVPVDGPVSPDLVRR